MTVSTTAWYGLDFNIVPAADKLGTFVELAIKPQNDTIFYLHIILQSKYHSVSKDMWLKIVTYGESQVVSDHEQIIVVSPSKIQGDWLELQIDLKKTIIETFGQEGWEFRQLEDFRVRGNTSLAYIKIYK